jgi:hypothetical protein
MSVLASFANAATSFFCRHEWCRRTEGRRLYLECLRCRATTPGIALRDSTTAHGHPHRRPVGHAVEVV